MKAKKVLAMLMASAMIMGTSVTAFAATPSQIEITNPTGIETSVTYTYIKIVEPDQESTIGWKFADSGYDAGTGKNVYAEAFKTAYSVGTEEEALNALIGDYGELSPNSNAEHGTIHTSVNLGEALNTLRSKAIKPVTGNTIEADTAGLYLIIGNATGYTFTPMLAYVEDAGSGDLVAAEVTAKASKDQVTKDVDDESKSVSAGDIVTYTAQVEYPYIGSDIQSPTFEITDTLTNATFVQDNITVWTGTGENKTELDSSKYSVQFENESTMKIIFNYDSAYAGQNVTIEYKATVANGVDSINNPLRNKIESNVNNNKTGYEVFVYPTTVQVTKVDETTNNPLSGAEITLYLEVANYDPSTADPDVIKLNVVTSDDGVSPITTEAKYAKVVKALTTDDDGEVTFDGLDADKTYFVKETKAPEGYSLNDYAYQLEGAATTGKLQEDTNKNGYDEFVYTSTPFDDETILDSKLSNLPSTGGIGTTIFTIGGCAIMVTAAGLYFATRKKTEK